MRRRTGFASAAALGGLLTVSLATGCGSKASNPFGDDSNADGTGTSTNDDGGGSTMSFGSSGGNNPSGAFSGDGGASVGTSLGDAGCATAMAEAKSQPAYLLFVLDGSGSMKQQNKWTAVVPALQAIFTQMEMAADPGVAAGLIVFSDSLDSTAGGGPYPSSADVPVAYVSSTQQMSLDGRLMGQPTNGTPTHSALMGGYGELEAFSPMSPLLPDGKKVLVLITDGVPTDDCLSVAGISNYSTNPCVEEAAQELTAASPKGPIETFVIGVGDFSSGSFFGIGGIDPSFLGNLAQAGGTGPMGCNPNEASMTSDLCYFEIDPSKSASASDLQMQFETALNAIRGQVLSCTFPIKSSGLGMVDPSLVNVEINGTTILQDAANGWTYDNPTMPTEIELHGAACTNAKGTITAKVSIVLGCATQIPK
jgi:von Willebrand factor type A domain